MLAVVQVVATLAAATLSYYLLELPIRRGEWLGFSINKPALVRLVPSVTAVMVIATVLALSQPIPEWMADPETEVVEVVQTSSSTSTTSGGVETTPRPEMVVAAVGDSVMVSLLPGLRDTFDQQGWTFVEGAVPACPVGFEPLYDDEGTISPYYDTRCRTAVPNAHADILEASPDIILWHDLQSTLSRRDASEQLLVAGTDPWIDDLVADWNSALDRLTSGGARVVFIVPPLRSQNHPGCEDSPLARCNDIQEQDERIRSASEVFLARNSDNDLLLDVTFDSLLCPDGYPCPSIVDGIEIRLGGNDQTHFTDEGAHWLARHIANLVSAISTTS